MSGQVGFAWTGVVPVEAGMASPQPRRDWNVRGATMSTWHPTRWLTGYAWDAITAACLLGPRPPRSLLLLGLGGGTVVRQLWRLIPDLEVTAVDLDPNAIRAAKRNLRGASGRITMVEGDAYEWLAQCRRRFDAVVDDVYASGPDDVYRPLPLGRALVQLLADRVRSDGVVAANLVTGPGHGVMLSTARRAFGAVFPAARAVRPAKGFNCVLPRGREVAAAGRLSRWLGQWPAADRVWWRSVRVGRGVGVR